jgi:Ca2+-dependent lipid-binding protein
MVETKHFQWSLTVVDAKLTRDVELVGKMDPFVVIKVDGKELKTKTIDNGGKNPVWN